MPAKRPKKTAPALSDPWRLALLRVTDALGIFPAAVDTPDEIASAVVLHAVDVAEVERLEDAACTAYGKCDAAEEKLDDLRAAALRLVEAESNEEKSEALRQLRRELERS